MPPVVICPYLYEHEGAEIRATFQLDTKHGRSIPFFAFHDAGRLGPELAFEHCWERFPDRDIVIVHSDMAPVATDRRNEWYEALRQQRDALPDAGIVACNLYFPSQSGALEIVQCAGGLYERGTVSYLRGKIGDPGLSPADLASARPVPWATFGGILLRREAIDAVGRFDRRYKWAYVMDVDYSFEVRLRGFGIYQVPVSLLHEEGRTTRPMMAADPRLGQYVQQNLQRLGEKWAPFASMLELSSAGANEPTRGEARALRP